MDPTENPFVGVVARKCRAIRKKLERIAHIEVQRSSGKILDDDQLTLLASKANLERAFIELEAVKSALEDVAKTEAIKSTSSAPAPAEQVTAAVAVAAINEATQSDITPTTDEGTMTTKESSSSWNAVGAVESILKALHVYAKYEQQTGRPLPLCVDFFGKSLLGLTSVSNFPDSLQQSSRMALMFLNPELSVSYEVLRGVTYADIASIVDGLANELSCLNFTGPTLFPIPAVQVFNPAVTPVLPASGAATAETTSSATEPAQSVGIEVEADADKQARREKREKRKQRREDKQQQKLDQSKQKPETGDFAQVSSTDLGEPVVPPIVAVSAVAATIPALTDSLAALKVDSDNNKGTEQEAKRDRRPRRNASKSIIPPVVVDSSDGDDQAPAAAAEAMTTTEVAPKVSTNDQRAKKTRARKEKPVADANTATVVAETANAVPEKIAPNPKVPAAPSASADAIEQTEKVREKRIRPHRPKNPNVAPREQAPTVAGGATEGNPADPVAPPVRAPRPPRPPTERRQQAPDGENNDKTRPPRDAPRKQRPPQKPSAEGSKPLSAAPSSVSVSAPSPAPVPAPSPAPAPAPVNPRPPRASTGNSSSHGSAPPQAQQRPRAPKPQVPTK